MLEKVLLKIFIIIIILSVFANRSNPVNSYANTTSQISDSKDLETDLKYNEFDINIAPYEKKLGEIVLSNPVFEKELDLVN